MAMSLGQRQAVWLECVRLPSNLFWCDIGGVTIFPLLSDGGQSYLANYVAILVEKYPVEPSTDLGREGLYEKGGGRWYTIRLTFTDGQEEIEAKVNEAIKALNGD